MKGRIPKDPTIRQRRNVTPGHATLSVVPGVKRRVPPLPKFVDDWEESQARSHAPNLFRDENGVPLDAVVIEAPRWHVWHPLTRQWWRDVWRSPMAAEYLQADMHGLYRLAYLIDKFWKSGSASLAAEIRLQQQSFGLTPIDRRRLQWEVERTEEATRKKARRVAPPEVIEDPRKALRVVGGPA